MLDKPFGKGMWLRVVMREGRKRQIRETGSMLGLPVAKIIRVRIGSLLLGSLKLREWRYLSAEEIQSLKEGKKFQRVARRPRPPARTSSAPKKAPIKAGEADKSRKPPTVSPYSNKRVSRKPLPKNRGSGKP